MSYLLIVLVSSNPLENLFFLLYGRDPRLPSVPALSPRKTRQQVNLLEYGVYVADKLSEAWDLAKRNIKKAQKQQKKTYDQHARPPNFTVGERAFLFKPAEQMGEKRKLAGAYHGPYRAIKLTSNNAHIRRVDRPEDDLLLVALDRLKRGPDEVCDTFWPLDHLTRNQTTAHQKKHQLRATNLRKRKM